jgi:ubiquinone/menaquinone biosynthesis C-methylase UbiE
MEKFMTNTDLIKPNLEYYSGEDLYSDGDIEDDVLQVFKQEKDTTLMIANDKRWPILYHLSPDRRNLLEWFPFKNDASLLEIGAGCGALTGLFCEKVRNVKAVELSKKRAEMICYRLKEHKNLEVIVGNFMEIPFKDKFDYVTLIGVLEYTESFIKTKDCYKELLNKARGLLKDDGTMLLAIENKFGLKYFAGAKEDHTGKCFSGIEGYLKAKGVRTFGKNELTDLLKESGFPQLDYYYPCPDYKLPDVIYSDEYLPDINNAMANSPNYDRDRYVFFNEKAAYMNIIKSGYFDLFANSFLVVAKQ